MEIVVGLRCQVGFVTPVWLHHIGAGLFPSSREEVKAIWAVAGAFDKTGQTLAIHKKLRRKKH